MVGDASAFIDPVWSTGVSLGLEGGLHAARQIDQLLKGKVRESVAIRRHDAWISKHRRLFMNLISYFYKHSFRELLVAGDGPFEVHRALVTLLAGEVFGGMTWDVKWRWGLLRALSKLNNYRALHEWVEPHSLLLSGGVDLPAPDAGVIGRWHRKLIAKEERWQPS